jgi:hypothetical protein
VRAGRPTVANTNCIAGDFYRAARRDDDARDITARLKSRDAAIENGGTVEYFVKLVARPTITGGASGGGKNDSKSGHWVENIRPVIG